MQRIKPRPFTKDVLTASLFLRWRILVFRERPAIVRSLILLSPTSSKSGDFMREHTPTSTTPIRAAHYVRMSTEHQQYSTENQLAAIGRYADAHGMEIARTYSDSGKSGLNIAGREGLLKPKCTWHVHQDDCSSTFSLAELGTRTALDGTQVLPEGAGACPERV